MDKSDILLFDKTYLDVEETFLLDGTDYVCHLLVNRSCLLRLVSKFVSVKKIYNIVAKIDFIASYFIVTFRALKSIILCCITYKKKSYNPAILGLFSCDLVLSRSRSAEIFDLIDSWLILPYTKFNKDEIDGNTISVYNLLSVKDVINSYKYSLRAITYSNNSNTNSFIRSLYVSFEFFLVRNALSNISLDTKLVFANHKDRWALLFDNSPQRNKILLQHGVESSRYKYPVKLKNITELYAFSRQSYGVLQSTILDCSPSVNFYKSTISLTPCPPNEKFKVLVISQIQPLQIQEEFVVSNLQFEDIEIYIKPHYQNKDYSFYEYLAKNNNFILIKEQIFQQVNVVISYKSTLAEEYQMLGIEVFMYENASLKDIVENVILIRDRLHLK